MDREQFVCLSRRSFNFDCCGRQLLDFGVSFVALYVLNAEHGLSFDNTELSAKEASLFAVNFLACGRVKNEFLCVTADARGDGVQLDAELGTVLKGAFGVVVLCEAEACSEPAGL